MKKLLSRIPNGVLVLVVMVFAFGIIPKITEYLFNLLYNLSPVKSPFIIIGALILLLAFIFFSVLLWWSLYKVMILLPHVLFDVKFLINKRIALALYLLVLFTLTYHNFDIISEFFNFILNSINKDFNVFI